MFSVRTEHPIEKARLEEEHPTIDKHFWVSSKDVHTLVGLLRSILFEYFRGSPPPLAEKLTQFVINALNMSLSLTLFREILSHLKSESSALDTYKAYFSELEQNFEQDNESIDFAESETSHINKLLNLNESRCSKFVCSPEFQEALEQEINRRNNLSQQSYLTRRTGLKDEQQTILESIVTRTKLQITLNRVTSHLTADQSRWWRRDNIEKCPSTNNNDSQTLIEYPRKRDNLLNIQDSINEMMRRQAQFDDYLELDRFTKCKKREQTGKKLNRRIKERLVSAKLCKRRKK